MSGELDEAAREEVAAASVEEDRGLAPVEPSTTGDPSEPDREDTASESKVSEVDELRAELDQLHNQLLRKRAEFDNFRRRTERERAEARDIATAEVLQTLLPTVDNLERAAAAKGDESSVQEGLALILKELSGFLEGHHLVAENPIEQQFDPERHQALSHEEVPGYSDGQIVEVFQKGYSIGDRLLRPALVRVAKNAGEPIDSDPESADEAGSE